ncbi:MAG: Panacea domain-containing protein [Chloroflexota bacterium]|nr:Panacea domain-containing protein [Chloroflexota bacterium]MDE2920154.1 Panacea domain-containing protein [Chloroflexota bacterium]
MTQPRVAGWMGMPTPYTDFEFNRTKLREAILYFSEKARDDLAYGTTRLYKQLFAADFWAFQLFGAPLTGTTYVRDRYGPRPDVSQGLDTLERMQADGTLEIAQVSGSWANMPVPKGQSKADLDIFTQAERRVLEIVARAFEYQPAWAVSEWTHEFPGWKFAQTGEPIPYATAYMWRDEDVSQDDMAWAYQEQRSLFHQLT